jgi:hypothetical protein
MFIVQGRYASRSMAKHCWPGQNAIGKRFHAGSFYFVLAGGTMPFIRRYSTIWP